MKFFHFLLVLLGSIAFFFIFYITARTVLPVLPEFTLWEGADFIIEIAGLKFPFFDLLFFATGMLVFCHGVLYLVYVTNYPDSLYSILSRGSLDDIEGPYSSIRHPMYTAFIMIELGLFSSLRSLYPVAFIVLLWLLQLGAALIEEYFVLKKRFPEMYAQYTASVNRRVFTPSLIVYSLIWTLLHGAGTYALFFGLE